MFGFIKKLFGTKNQRELNKLFPIVSRINEFEPTLQKLSDDELRGKTAEFRQRLANGEPLEKIVPEAFAVTREAGVRVLGMRHYDVQMIGGLVLHSGKIAEMRTGEGKTLVATLPVYTNALLGRGVHVVTVNDYLASRDAEWMGRLYKFLGMSVGTIVHGLTSKQRQDSYGSDITYGTNNEYGFDYLRDNMQFYLADYVQRELYFAIVDEVDSILIDEARTPLIISGRSEESSELYHQVNPLIPKLKKVDIAGLDAYKKIEQEGKEPPPGDFVVDEKAHSVLLTEEGIEKIERLLGQKGLMKGENLYDPQNLTVNHHVQQALRAHTLYKRDVNYIIEEGKVVIVDEHTGRKMPGRRWSDGLHQAVEAKEAVKVEEENRTLATVTFQNFFRMYKKLGGMTGTADTEAEEFAKIYNLDVMVIPTNRPMIRKDADDLVYKTYPEKVDAVIQEILECNERGQPVLVGTVSVEKNELFSRYLSNPEALARAVAGPAPVRTKNMGDEEFSKLQAEHKQEYDTALAKFKATNGLKHEVLNAKQHAREAEIVAQAGRKGSITVATNMAGRGTDILLGGNAEFLAKNEVGAAPLRPEGASDEDYQALLAEHEKKIKAAHDRFKAQCNAEREEVLALGGLHIVGTERHESRRIDNQLRGRAGRQGDPGSSRFYLSLDDDLMRLFAADRIKAVMDFLKIEEGVPIEHKWVTKAIGDAQRKVEAHHFDARKHLLDYDDVMNQQRKSIYKLRRNVLEGKALRINAEGELEHEDGTKVEDELAKDLAWPKDRQSPLANLNATPEARAEAMKKALEGTWRQMLDLVEEITILLVDEHCSSQHSDEWDIEGLRVAVQEKLNVDIDFSKQEATIDAYSEAVFHAVEELLNKNAEKAGSERVRSLCRWLYLREIDDQWMEHLSAMEHLREGIGLRGYGSKDPKIEYKKEGFNLFTEMLLRIKENTVQKITHLKFQEESRPESVVPVRRPQDLLLAGGGDNKTDAPERGVRNRGARLAVGASAAGASAPAAGGSAAARPGPGPDQPKPGRNDPCYCGSGKKYKKCHMELDGQVDTNRL
jgi:preprotein translocase subunit SecA